MIEIIACAGVIGLMVIVTERRSSRLRKDNEGLIEKYNSVLKDHKELGKQSSKNIFDYNVLVSMLEEEFDEEELDERFKKHKENLIKKNGGSDRYEGKFFTKDETYEKWTWWDD